MPNTGYLSIPGIKGSSKSKLHAGKIRVIAVTHDVAADVDEVSGIPKGKDKWKHKPLVVTTAIDLATPKLHELMESKKPVTGVTIVEFWREPPGGGTEENYFTITMNNAQVAFIRTVMIDARNPANRDVPEYEEVGFTYDGIGWGWHSGGNAGGTDPTEKTSYVAKNTVFAVPDEAALRAMVLSTIQSALAGGAAEILEAAKALDQPGAAPPK